MSTTADSTAGNTASPKISRHDGPSAAVRIRVMKRDRFRCTYCGVPGTDAELEIDHIIPVSKGGSHHISNLTTACRACNQEKGDKTRSPIRSDAHTQSLIGMFLHTLKDGKIHWQGKIIGTDGNIALVQLFSWLDGRATNVVPIDKKTLYSEDQCKLYGTADAWETAYEIELRRERAKH